jgi:OmpA-OmpF porin, OOP family
MRENDSPWQYPNYKEGAMKHGRLLGLIPVLCLAAASAYGQGSGGPGWYAGLDFGQSKLDSDSGLGGDRDDTSNTWSLRAGYRFTRFFALEAGYIDMGDFSESFTGPCVGCGGIGRTSIDGFLVNAIGKWPVAEHFHLKGVLGATYRELEASFEGSGVRNQWSESTTIFSFGVGVAIPINERFEVDVDYTHYREIGLGLTVGSSLGVIDNAESNLVTLGLRFHF